MTPEVIERLKSSIIGQSPVIDALQPYLNLYFAGLSPVGRPAGSFLLLGPTGVGKTFLCECLSEILHNKRNILCVNCGEYQSDHEVAKLIGAPPGYLGHRETKSILSTQALAACRSDKSPLAIVLLDEIEKAAPALSRLLLGVLDKGILQLGDNTTVTFDNTMIFMTSNLGTKEIIEDGRKCWNMTPSCMGGDRVKSIALGVLRKKYPPEFLARIDEILVYSPLDEEAIFTIADLKLHEVCSHVFARKPSWPVSISWTEEVTRYFAGYASISTGVRSVKRAVEQQILQSIATIALSHPRGATVRFEMDNGVVTPRVSHTDMLEMVLSTSA